MNRTLLSLILLFIRLSCYSQKEWDNWYNSGQALLSFQSGQPQVITNYITPKDGWSYYYWGDPGISYADPVSGKMKFIVSNHLVFGPDYEAYKDADILRSCDGDEFSYHIIPFHNDADKFYILQFQSVTADLLAQETGLQVRCPNAIGLGYSIIDLSKNNGNGTLTLTNQQVVSRLTGQMTTVRHANGKDVWVIVHPYGSNQFFAYLVTDAGFQNPVISNAGPVINAGSESTYGTLTSSHDGKLLAGYSRAVQNNVQLFDFDNASGRISNYRTLPSDSYIYKLQFSPDDSKLYSINNDFLSQYDFNQPDVASSLTKIYRNPYDYLFDMQLAPDGKIYISKTSTLGANNYHEFTAAIECPDLPQYACNFNERALSFVNSCFPDLINDFIHDPKAMPVTKFNIGNDTAVCFGSLTLTAPDGWESYRWNTGATTKKITVTKPGVYYVLTGNTGFSCPEGYGYINVADAAIKLNLGNDTLLCPGNAYSLHVDDTYSDIRWQNGSNTRDSLITANGSYIISAHDSNGCPTKDTISIYFKTNLKAQFDGSDTTLCNNESLKLVLVPRQSSSTNATYEWQDGSTADNFIVTKSGTYWGTVNYDGCSASDTIRVSYVSAEAVNLGNDTSLCEGDSLLLKSNINNAGFLWSTGATSPSIYVNNTGDYWLRVNNASCTVTDTIHVTFNNKPVFSLGNDTSLCDKQTLLLHPAQTGNYLWQDGTTANNYTISNAGWYWLHLTQNGCTASDSISVTYKPLPTVNLGDDTGFCEGGALTLDAYNASINSYYWQDNSTQPNYLVTKAGTYFVQVTGFNNCLNSDTISITVTQPPAFSLGADTVLCDGATLNYNFNIAGASYLWNDGSAAGQYSINTAGDYWLTVIQSGCSRNDTIHVDYKPSPIVNLGNDTTLCEGTSYLLNAFNAGASYVWQDNSTQPAYTVFKPGTYYVQVNLNGCINADTALVYYKTKPVFSLGDDSLICPGVPLTLSAATPGARSYKWQDGSTADHYIAATAGLYSVQVTNECGTATRSINVTNALCELEMPDAFTPNNDGVNDKFGVKYPQFIKAFHIIIYNRWGSKVFETTDPYLKWDGTVKSIPQNIGSYVWMIDFTDNNNKQQTAHGMVTLLR